MMHVQTRSKTTQGRPRTVRRGWSKHEQRPGPGRSACGKLGTSGCSLRSVGAAMRTGRDSAVAAGSVDVSAAGKLVWSLDWIEVPVN